MDARHLDRLTRALSTTGKRRRMLGLLATLPLLGGVRAFLTDAEDAEAKGHRKRRHKDRDRDVSAQKKRKKKKCKAPPLTKTCAGKCGPVTNKCKKTVDCGSCVCGSGCKVCFTCQSGAGGSGECVIDPQKQGGPCGTPGQVCQGDGNCRCDLDSCANPTPVCVGVTCTACSLDAPCPSGQCCDGGSCVDSCPLNETCVDGVCTCQCALGCTPGSVQDAIDAADPGETITLCSGTFGAIDIDKNLTLIGAGANVNPVNNTILDANGNGTVVTVAAGVIVTLEKVRIIGGNATEGGGILNNGALTLTECEVTGNSAVGFGGGISNRGVSSTLILDSSFVIENEAASGGGIFNNGTLTLNNGSGIQNNTATTTGGGLHNRNILILNGTSNISGNGAGTDGGGIFNNAVGNVTLNGNSFVTNNTADDDGGGIFTGDNNVGFVCNVTLNGASSVGFNEAGDEGGGIYMNSGTVNLITAGGVADNTADIGGGIFVAAGDLTIAGSTLVTENTATSAFGGIRNVGGTVALQGDSRVCSNTPGPQCSGVAGPPSNCQEFCPPST